MKSTLQKFKTPILMLLVFEAVAITLWLTLNNLFYLFNFTYIGAVISFGLVLFVIGFKHARLVVQLGVGLYMFVFLGLISGENMQIEGFWYFLFLGVFQAAVIHYLVAKIAGPLLFGRGWCGYACWTAMVLDLLPYKKRRENDKKRSGLARYVVLAASFVFVLLLFYYKASNVAVIMYLSFLIGNAAYYSTGIILAFIYKDNRAFCKYVCPIAVFMKPLSRFSLLRVKVDDSKCISCKLCQKSCPMGVDMLDNSRSRKNGTECILCMECIQKCPVKALHT